MLFYTVELLININIDIRLLKSYQVEYVLVIKQYNMGVRIRPQREVWAWKPILVIKYNLI